MTRSEQNRARLDLVEALQRAANAAYRCGEDRLAQRLDLAVLRVEAGLQGVNKYDQRQV